jgi:hypothetical protein
MSKFKSLVTLRLIMKTRHFKFSIAFVFVFGLSLASSVAVSHGQRGGKMVPATVQFLSDGSGGMLRSDGLGSYTNGKSQCVTANVSDPYFYMRTVTNACRTKTPRRITVDLGNAFGNPTNCPGFIQCPHEPIEDSFNQIGTLDMCGLNSLEDVTLRATRLFADPVPTNQLTEVQVEFNLSPDFKNTAFYLTGAAYIQLGANSNERILTTGADRAEFYLVMIKQTGERVCLGNYYLPFTIRVTKGT